MCIKMIRQSYIKDNRKRILFIIIIGIISIILFFVSLFVGSSNISFADAFNALFGKGEKANILIMHNVRLPRAIAALVLGFGMGISGLMMQTNLNNDMASPATLGVSGAAVLGANIAIIILSGGVVNTANGTNFSSDNPYFVSFIAFLFSLGSIILILILAKIKKFSPSTIILIGIALGSIYEAITTLIQYFAVDTRLTSAVFWSFGDLERGNMRINYIIIGLTLVSFIIFMLLSKNYNAISSGDEVAKTLGVNTNFTRFVSLLLASLITAISVANFGIIGFIGIIAPHIVKRLIGNNHRFVITASGIMGSIILLISDILSKVLMNGFSLPVGAITAIIGAPFFLYIVFTKSRGNINA